ncbi:hypothetical protein Taro_054662 [Colocasia esculenta]|uniref:BZIP domain-containing protein n=1 Tax=Colocasia esculenta TaxID=4460 RepID=A0A843XPG3_COLES|nr:hypothetical protein [Colocasia esculenta]
MADLAGPAEPDALGGLEFLSDVYLDFDGVGGLDLFLDLPSVVDPPAALPDAPVELVPSQLMDDVERFLMMEEGGGGVGEDERLFADDFFADVLSAGSDEGSVRSAVSNSDATTPDEGEGEGKENSEGDVEPEANAVESVVEREKGTDGDESEGKGGEDENLLSKKRRRQMRNRDSAMKSRERKKLYVRDLEVKSKFLESECRRLQNALNCCASENIALRQCLQKANALGAPLAKQESAVLFVGKILTVV